MTKDSASSSTSPVPIIVTDDALVLEVAAKFVQEIIDKAKNEASTKLSSETLVSIKLDLEYKCIFVNKLTFQELMGVAEPSIYILSIVLLSLLELQLTTISRISSEINRNTKIHLTLMNSGTTFETLPLLDWEEDPRSTNSTWF